MRLTQMVCDKLRAPETGRVAYADSDLRGFGLRIFAGGHRSWYVNYRWHGRLHRHTIRYDAVPNVGDARKLARELLAKVERGEDPAARPPAEVPTVAAVADRFVSEYAKKRLKAWKRPEANLRRFVVPSIGKRLVTDVRRSDLREVISRVAADNGPIAANRLLATLSKMFSWACEMDIIENSPAAHIQRPSIEVSRDRVLTDAELAAIWRASEAIAHKGAFVRLLITTAQRRGEVSGMRWSELDLEQRVWRLGRTRTKSGVSHQAPLSDLALRDLEALRQYSTAEFVFGHRPMVSHSMVKRQLVAHLDMPIQDWHFHDLRRSAATGMAALGVAPMTISRVLAHSEGGVTRIYNRHSYLAEKRQALDTWSDHLSRLVGANVITLPRAG